MGEVSSVSPFAPAALVSLPPIDGVAFATAEAGIRYKGRTDLLLAVLDEGTSVAGVLTQSKTASAPVLICRKHLKKGSARAIVVNSGNANAFTGKRGREAVDITVERAVEAVGCKPHEVFVASTGVIGEPLDAGKFAHLLTELAERAESDAFDKAARAIMTTDTYPKLATRTALIGDTEVTINGFCKGAGMIAPDMATMLCFIFTDAAISAEALQALITQHAQTTFNCMTVDGDTSTSDTCLIFATGRAAARGQKPVIKAKSKKLQAFSDALHDLIREGRRRTFEVRDFRGRGCQIVVGCSQNRARLRQLADPQDGHRGGGSKLGPRRHGRRQIGRSRKPRQAHDLVRPALRCAQRRARRGV
jgi:glutamate N-acetyltransferase/amino-acid N-acetyltransferase